MSSWCTCFELVRIGWVWLMVYIGSGVQVLHSFGEKKRIPQQLPFAFTFSSSLTFVFRCSFVRRILVSKLTPSTVGGQVYNCRYIYIPHNYLRKFKFRLIVTKNGFPSYHTHSHPPSSQFLGLLSSWLQRFSIRRMWMRNEDVFRACRCAVPLPYATPFLAPDILTTVSEYTGRWSRLVVRKHI